MLNIVLIVTDTYRYDNLAGRCATMPVRTPELDRFARERATQVHGFHTGSYPTIPHRTDIATGRLGWPHFGWQPIDLSSRNHIATLLGAQGYATQLICDCPHLFRARFDTAFTAALHVRGQEGDKPLLHLNDPIETVMPADKTRIRPQFLGHPLVDTHRWTNRYPQREDETFPARTGNTVIRWLEENARYRPFFLWADFFDPHEPWDPPEYLVRRYDLDYQGTPMLHPNYGPSSAYTPGELRNLRAHYAAEAELVDRWVGRVLQKIDDLALWDRTVVVVTSDHGFSIGEHDRTGKSNIHDADSRFWPIYPEIGHVPFLVAAPGLPRGADLDLLAQPVDFLPTACDLAEVTIQPPEPLHGRSFATALRQGGGTHRDCVVGGCHVRPGADGLPPRRTITPFVVQGSWGYTPVGAQGAPELYDLARDPLAEHDVASRYPQQVQALQAALLAFLREHGAPPEVVRCWDAVGRQAGSPGGTWAIDYPKPTV